MSESLKDEAARVANPSEDKNGSELAIGDVVQLTGRVTAIQPAEAKYDANGIDLTNKNGQIEIALNGMINGQTVYVFSNAVAKPEEDVI